MSGEMVPIEPEHSVPVPSAVAGSLLPLGYAALLVLCAILFFHRLGDRGLHSSHEARAGQNGQTILLKGDWLLPQLFDRQVELQKPPLYYWLVACFGLLNGGRVDAWAIRLPAAFCAVGCIVVLVELGRRRGRPLAGLLAGCILATFLHFTWLARVGRIDMPLTFTTSLTLAAFYINRCQERRARGRGTAFALLIGYLALGLGVLLKGPIALVLPAAVGAAVVCSRVPGWWRGGRPRPVVMRLFRDDGVWWGVPLVLAVALPWFVAANAATRGDQFRVFFWYHNFARGFGGEEALAEKPVWFYAERLIRDLLPWSLLLPPAAWYFFRRRLAAKDPLAGLGLCWLLGVTVLLTCMRFKRADYLLPAYPGAALFLGCMAEDAWRRVRIASPVAVRRAVPGLFAAVVVACVLGWGYCTSYWLPGKERHHPEEHFARQVRSETKALILFFRVEAHEVAFHLGPPVNTIVEWENLDRWLALAPDVYVIMARDDVAEWPRQLHNGHLKEIVRSADLAAEADAKSLVLLRATR